VTGKVVHFEVPADDVNRAQKFYHDAFGWQMQPMPEMSYTMVSTTKVGSDGMPTEPGAINGGMAARTASFKTPVITIAVDDIDDALATVEKLGGKTAEGRTQVGDMGYAAYFVDTEGNTIGLWQQGT
jgi:uncharacterized protein